MSAPHITAEELAEAESLASKLAGPWVTTRPARHGWGIMGAAGRMATGMVASTAERLVRVLTLQPKLAAEVRRLQGVLEHIARNPQAHPANLAGAARETLACPHFHAGGLNCDPPCSRKQGE